MIITSATEGLAALNLTPSHAIVPSKPPTTETSLANDTASVQAAQSKVVKPNQAIKVTQINKPSPLPGAKGTDKKVQRMSSVVEVYNTKGKKRMKFLDSNNNVIYQIPSELAARIEDLMAKPNSSTDKQG